MFITGKLEKAEEGESPGSTKPDPSTGLLEVAIENSAVHPRNLKTQSPSRKRRLLVCEPGFQSKEGYFSLIEVQFKNPNREAVLAESVSEFLSIELCSDISQIEASDDHKQPGKFVCLLSGISNLACLSCLSS
jgi:hypothetical protein